MKIVSFIERCQGDVVEQILRHCGLWEGPLRTRTGARPPPRPTDRTSGEHDLQFVPDPEYQQAECFESNRHQSTTEKTRELQSVLDPDYL